MGKTRFRPWEVSQGDLFPPAFRDAVPQGHLVHFVRSVVMEDLDLTAIYAKYTEAKGQPPYDPRLMTALLLYTYCRSIYTSRKIEIACEERLDYRALVGDQRPDHTTIAKFRKDHRDALAALFVQILALCRDAGMAKLGHVSFDGTKIKANASRHAAMSYERMKQAEPELAKLVDDWLDKAQAADDADDAEHGPDKRGDEIPEHVKQAARKLAKVWAAQARIEADATAEAEQIAAERAAKEAESGEALRGRAPKALDGEPQGKTQSNFTDPESRIMKAGQGYEQAYNAQAAVDAGSQVIVACEVVAQQNDGDRLVPMIEQIAQNTGALPSQVSADAAYCSEANLAATAALQIDAYVATGRQKHGTASPTSNEKAKQGPLSSAMREKLRQGGYASPYRLRKQTVEPVFGQIKEARGFRRFLRRGLANVQGEWSLLCTVHNLLKLAAVRAATRASVAM